MNDSINIYSDKTRLGTVFANKEDAEVYLLCWLRECFSTGGDPNDMPKLVEIKKRVSGQTWTVWLVACSN
jgi:hypothetical protein